MRHFLRRGPRFRPARSTSVAAAVLLAAAFAVGAAATALAQDGSASDGSVAPSFSGPCDVSANIAGFGGIDPKASGGVYTVPKSGSASYSGSIAVEGKDRFTTGKVEVALPAGAPAVNIKSWQNDNTDNTSDSGSVSWDIPSWVPGNVELKVSGFHQDQGARCEGSIVVKLDGGFFDSAFGPAALVVTVLGALGLLWSAFGKRGA